MDEDHVEGMIADLEEAAAIQQGFAHQRLALEWGQTLFGKLARAWMAIEAYESFAYEDKVALQVGVLDEATASLWHLHKAFVGTRRLLKRHQQDLRVPGDEKSPAIRQVQHTSAPGKAPHLPRRQRRVS